MGVLNYEAFLRQKEAEEEARRILEMIQSDIWPFRLGKVDLYIDFDVDFRNYRFFLRSTTLPGDEIKVIFSGDDYLEIGPEWIARPAAAAIRSLQNEPVPHNVHLGEN